MATQRYISTSFWDDEWIQTLDPSEKLLYLYLMTNPLTSIAGVYKITTRRMAFDTGFNIDTISHILGKFKTAKKAFHYKDFIILPTWPKHQQWEHRSKIKTGIDAELAKLPEELKAYMVSIGYRYPIEGYAYDPNYSDSDSDIDSDLNNAASSDAGAEEEDFRVVQVFAPSPPSSPRAKKERDPLRDALAASFRAKIPEYASPAKENANLLRLASAIRRRAAADQTDETEAARGILETFWRLHESGKQFYADFTPSKALAAFESLWTEYRKGAAAADVSWVGEAAS